jgi:hypothetical protein
MTDTKTAAPTIEDHQKAFTEVSFLLNIFAATVQDLMGGATAPVGRIAGRHAAAKLPVYLPAPTLEAVLAELAKRLERGVDLSCRVTGRSAELTFGRCAIREACAAQNLEPGQELCSLFHYYLDGIVNGLLQRPVKSSLVEKGARCTARLDTR